MAEQGSDNQSQSRPGVPIAIGICALAFAGAVVWLFWPESPKNSPAVSQTSGNSRNNPPNNPANNTANPVAHAAPDVAPAPAPAGGRGNRPPPADLAPQPIDPILIADSQPNDAFHPSRAGGLTLNQLLGDLAPSTTSVPTTQTTDEAIRLENARKFVLALCTDHSGNLWVGTEEGGIQCWNRQTNQWRQFTTRDGLGDDFCYALACDKEGRIWAGHLNHGVSVFNGQQWQNYEIVGGLSRPDTLSGPLGERIFSIKVCPADGDVWIATNCGLARFSDSKNTWSYYTMENGLPSDQANALAFDPDGNLYVATQCDGIAIAKASEDYQHWKQITGPGPEAEPQSADGDGLPSNLMNDILVAKNSTIYTATDAGLGFSKDKGQSWKFIRGKDWQDKVRGLMVNDPVSGQGRGGRQRLQLTGEGVLAEDYCTCLAETADGKLWVGHRQKDVEVFDADLNRLGNVPIALNDPWVHAMVANDIPMIGTHSDGVMEALNVMPAPSTQPSLTIAAMPASAAAPTEADLDNLLAKNEPLRKRHFSDPAKYPYAEFMGDDWATQGDWVGRYGRQEGRLCGGDAPSDRVVIYNGLNYPVETSAGPHVNAGDSYRDWVQYLYTDDLRSLFDPLIGTRRQSEWDDHGEAYAQTREGPDLHATVTLPAGVTRVSLYFYNYDRVQRDYAMEVRATDADTSSPPLAHCRIECFEEPVYKQFRLTGPGKYTFIIHRNHSLNTMMSGVMFDRLVGEPDRMEQFGLPLMAGVQYLPHPEGDIQDQLSASAYQLWQLCGMAQDTVGVGRVERQLRIDSYRALAPTGNNYATLLNWRWHLSLWDQDQRNEFIKATSDGWKAYTKTNPQLVEFLKRTHQIKEN